VRYHHDPPRNGEVPEGVAHAVRGVYLSDQLAHAIARADAAEGVDLNTCLDQEIVTLMEPRQNELGAWAEETREQYREVHQLFR
jgi:hypothetical protein